jgi:hypothetical protein
MSEDIIGALVVQFGKHLMPETGGKFPEVEEQAALYARAIRTFYQCLRQQPQEHFDKRC